MYTRMGRDDLDFVHGRPPAAGRPRGFDANMQNIASVAHRRGVIVTRNKIPVRTLEPATLCKALRTAHEMSPDHVAMIANGLALSIGKRGSLEVPQATLNVITGYVNKAAGKAIRQ